MKHYDIVIIGSGPGGYVAALYAARHKKSVCVIEKDLLGGTCLNRGCMPTKSLLTTASSLTTIKGAELFGIAAPSPVVHFDLMMARKDEVVRRLRTGIETLFRAGKIDLVKGTAALTGPTTVRIKETGDSIEGDAIIIATGSRVTDLPSIAIDEKTVISSDGALTLKELPQSIVIIGGGVVGCEFAHLFNTLGSKVTIVELTDRLLPTQSREIGRKLEAIFRRRGIDVLTAATVTAVTREKTVRLTLADNKTVEAAAVLVSVGRRSDIDDLGLAALGIAIEGGRIVVDRSLRTAVPTIYAIGDCVPGPQLAHKASYDARIACDVIMGKARATSYENIPSCIWTDPQIASVGLTEEEAKTRHPDLRVAKFPYLASGKAYIMGKSEGFIKIMGTPDGTIAGVEIFGEEACELIAEAVLARTAGITIDEWAHAVHCHPTLSEIVHEAACIFAGTPIHSI